MMIKNIVPSKHIKTLFWNKIGDLIYADQINSRVAYSSFVACDKSDRMTKKYLERH
jgi:hypothetical protein